MLLFAPDKLGLLKEREFFPYAFPLHQTHMPGMT